MNHTIVKVFSYIMLAFGVLALWGGLYNPSDQSGYQIAGGLMFAAQSILTLIYANKASKEARQTELASAVALEMAKTNLK